MKRIPRTIGKGSMDYEMDYEKEDRIRAFR
jgi:hypothetical protein